MHRDERIDEIVAAWREQRKSGEAVSAEVLVESHPDLAHALRARLFAIRALDIVEPLHLDVATHNKIGLDPQTGK